MVEEVQETYTTKLWIFQETETAKSGNNKMSLFIYPPDWLFISRIY